MRILFALVCVAFIVPIGCAPTNPSSSPNTDNTPIIKTSSPNDGATNSPQAAARPLVRVANPRYQSWSGKKIGTKLTILEKTETPHLKTESKTVYQLKSITPDQVIVEVTSEIVQPDGTKIPTPAQEMTYPKMMQVDEKQADAPLQPPGTSSSRTAELTILGKKYNATVYQSKGRVEAGETLTETWVVAEFPGCVVKTTHTIPAMKKTVSSEVASLDEN